MDIRIDKAITVMVEAMLPRWSGKLGLEIAIDLNWTVYSNGEEDDDRINKTIHFLFLREKNYTMVFARVLDVGDRIKEIDEWKLVGDHDSGWDSGLETLIRGVVLGLSNQFKDKNPSKHAGFSIFNPPCYRTVEYSLINGQDRFTGMYDVMLGKKMSHLEAAQMMKMKA